jgi:hypothetical protein
MLGGWESFFLPIADAAKLYGFIARLQKGVSGTRRAPAASSVEDDFGIFGQLADMLLDPTHRDVDCPGNRAAFVDFFRIAHIDKDHSFLLIELLFQFRNGYSLRSHGCSVYQISGDCVILRSDQALILPGLAS